jgi:hypothetical protein
VTCYKCVPFRVWDNQVGGHRRTVLRRTPPCAFCKPSSAQELLFLYFARLQLLLGAQRRQLSDRAVTTAAAAATTPTAVAAGLPSCWLLARLKGTRRLCVPCLESEVKVGVNSTAVPAASVAYHWQQLPIVHLSRGALEVAQRCCDTAMAVPESSTINHSRSSSSPQCPARLA